MNSLDKTEWMIGELLATPYPLFVLWLIQEKVCLTLDDFRRHYSPAGPAAELVRVLETDGFLDLKSGEIALTRLGERALACFASPRSEKILLADHEPKRATEMTRAFPRLSEFDVERIPSVQKLRSRLESPLNQSGLGLVVVAPDLCFDESLPARKGKMRNRLHSAQLAELLSRHVGLKFYLARESLSMKHLFRNHPNLFDSVELAHWLSDSDQRRFDERVASPDT
jgi:hypothetical protein